MKKAVFILAFLCACPLWADLEPTPVALQVSGSSVTAANPLPITGSVTSSPSSTATPVTSTSTLVDNISGDSLAFHTTTTFLVNVLASTVGVTDAGGSLTVDAASATFKTSSYGQASLTGGTTRYRNLDLDETGISVKGSPTQIYGGWIYNAASSVRYLKFYNKATAPTVGTDTPYLTLPLPATSLIPADEAEGVMFSLGLGVGCTTGLADNDVGAPSANDCIVNLFYTE